MTVANPRFTKEAFDERKQLAHDTETKERGDQFKAAFNAYKDDKGSTYSEHDLLKLVMKELASSAKRQYGKVCITEGITSEKWIYWAEDRAQDLIIEVAEKMRSGYFDTHYNLMGWLKIKINFMKNDAIKTVKEAERFEPLVVKHSNELGAWESENVGREGVVPVPLRQLPTWIQGIDLEICEYIREDMTYKAIGDLLGMSESAVAKRLNRMKKKNELNSKANTKTVIA